MAEQKDNRKLFNKIVRNFNAEHGYSFKLPEDTDFTQQYAHPVHEDAAFKITSQIDDHHNKDIYALTVQMKNTEATFHCPDISYEQLMGIFNTDAFKVRLSALIQLRELSKELCEQEHRVLESIVEESISDREREETYDTIMLVARKLYRP
jgi:hypothetical protein